MKSRLLLSFVLVGLLAVTGCDDDADCIIYDYDSPPAAPQGVYSVTGDHAVYVHWNGPYETDIVEYVIWWSSDSMSGYTEIGRRSALTNPNRDLIYYVYVVTGLPNGVKYFYAVSAIDASGQESELSAEPVSDTPRPDGWVTLHDIAVEPNLTGFHFETQSVVPMLLADVYVDWFDSIYYLNAANTATDLQDMGFTSDFDEINRAPLDGWSNLGYVEIIPGHTYVIWTDDYHYAKMRVQSVNSSSVTFQWAYQTDQDNIQLVAPLDRKEKPVHGPGYLRENNTTIGNK